jgi:hypothetical protein
VAAINLGSNNLNGTIPAELGNLTELTSLNMFNNQLRGSIPQELSSLTNLSSLQLYENQLTGIIPAELGNLKSMITFNLAANQLSGNIPVGLGNLTDLTLLVLRSNQLSGEIPIELGNLTSLIDFQLYDNQLTGTIPTELGNLTNLSILWFGINALSGVIPTSLGNLKNLSLLDLSSTQLSGNIPIELSGLINLGEFDLSSTQLSGTIPSEFGNLTSLNKFWLNDNPNFDGSIPLSLTELSLETFSFQNTGVCEPSNSTYQTWKSTVTTYNSSGVECAISATDIEAFSFAEQTTAAVINPENHELNIEVEFGTDLTALIASFTLSSGATAQVNAIDQIRAATANDFTSAVVYTVIAEDGVTIQNWTVTVTVAPITRTDVLSFGFPQQIGASNINSENHTIDLQVAYGTDVTSLTPTIALSPNATISPASGVAQDFTIPVTYTVTA